jgi:hypothetical protein
MCTLQRVVGQKGAANIKFESANDAYERMQLQGGGAKVRLSQDAKIIFLHTLKPDDFQSFQNWPCHRGDKSFL